MHRISLTVTTLMIVPLILASEAVRGDIQRSDRASLHAILGADALALNVNGVRRRAAELPLAERYDFLKDWVLPNAIHRDFRVGGEFTPTNPSSRAMELEPYRFPSDRGGDLVSPVFDLLEAATELGRLDDLYAAVSSLAFANEERDARTKLVLLTLICLAQERSEEADEHVAELHRLLDKAFQDLGSDFTAELLLIYDAVVRKRELELVADLLAAFHNNRHAFDMSEEWKSHLCTLVGDYREQFDSDSQVPPGSQESFQNWIPVARSIAMTRGTGYPPTSWHRQSSGELHLLSGHHRDYLFFRSPLAGNYEVTGELDLGGRTQMMSGGVFVGPHGGRTSIEIGKFRSEYRVQPIDPPFPAHEHWVRYRADVDDGRLRVFLNERLMLKRELGSNPDPWVAARGLADSVGGLRHLQISGEPEILETVDLTSQAAFTSWYAYYFHTEDVGNPRSLWQWQSGENGLGEIVAKRYPAPRGSAMESILRYHRPLVEDGSIEYEFFYAPDDIHVHPLLDRLAFVLQPEGVGLHWCTDGRHDRTAVAPDDLIFSPDDQRGSRPLPLVPDNWNHMKVSLAGQTVTLTLNGRLVFEYALPDSNLRTFGFFRYSDQTLSRIRGVTMRGAWPKEVPPVSQQEFADPRLVTLHEEIADLPAEFHHDFITDGLPEELFKLTGKQLDTGITEESDGVHVKLDGDSGWTVAALMPQVHVSGDFDIRAEFDLRDLDSSWQNGLAFLEVRLPDEGNSYFRSMRGYEPEAGHSVRSQQESGPHDGRRQMIQERFASWSPAGCFRIVRTGDRLTSLFAPKDSSIFRVLGQQQITDDDIPTGSILLELAVRHVSQGHVVWKNLSIRAEELN